MTELQDRVQIAIEAAHATVSERHWMAGGTEGEHETVVVADYTSYTALCDQLNAKRDGGRLLGAGYRMHDALTKDNRVLIIHRCWPHLDCWEGR